MDSLDSERELNSIIADPVGFLRTGTEGTDTAAKLLPYLAYQYQERLANLWELAMSLKEQLKRRKCATIINLLKEIDPDTGKKHSREKADILFPLDSEYQRLYNHWIATENQRRTVAGYLSSLELKASFIPGMQGRLNRWLNLEAHDTD